MHLNLLTAFDDERPPVPVVRDLSPRWASDIAAADAGFVAAYITKFEQLPPRELYKGRTVSLFGDWLGREAKPLREHLINMDGDCRSIGDILAGMGVNQKTFAGALVSAETMLAIMRRAAPEVMRGIDLLRHEDRMQQHRMRLQAAKSLMASR